MTTPQPDAVFAPHSLRTARVIRVDEHACEVWSHGEVSSVGFAPMFPSPRVERVSPGRLVALAIGPNRIEVVVWTWYDTVVLGTEDGGSVRLWEPGHGEVIASLDRESRFTSSATRCVHRGRQEVLGRIHPARHTGDERGAAASSGGPEDVARVGRKPGDGARQRPLIASLDDRSKIIRRRTQFGYLFRDGWRQPDIHFSGHYCS
jgi:hypothetical protein